MVGFDNVPQAEWGSYRLTTVEQPVEPMIEATVGLLQNYLRDDTVPATENVVVPGALIVRDSARRPPPPGAKAAGRSRQPKPAQRGVR